MVVTLHDAGGLGSRRGRQPGGSHTLHRLSASLIGARMLRCFAQLVRAGNVCASSAAGIHCASVVSIRVLPVPADLMLCGLYCDPA